MQEKAQKPNEDIKKDVKTPDLGNQKQEAKGKTPVSQQGVNLSPDEREKLRQMSQLSLWLDRYEDIFSDFDPRSYSQRVLSDDFLAEAKKVSKDTASGKIQLNLLMPADKRNTYHESVIKKRLREHFKERYESHLKRKTAAIKQGSFFVLLGIVLMFIATFLLFKYEEKNMFISFLIVLLEPGGWFLFWEGLHQIIFVSKEQMFDLKFYKRLASCDIFFLPY